MTEFTINGIEYRSGKLDTFKQLHVSRKIAPLVPKLLPVFVAFKQGKKPNDEMAIDDLGLVAQAIQPVTDVLAEMSDQDVEFVFDSCLSAVHRRQGRDWQPIWRNGVLMFDDIEMPLMIQLTLKVIWDNLGGFIRGLLAKQTSSSPVEA